MNYKSTNYSDIKNTFIVKWGKVSSQSNLKIGLILGSIVGLALGVITQDASTGSITGLICFALCYVPQLIFASKASIGISENGLWIGPSSHRNSRELGFFQWGWIKNISISQNDGNIYISLYNFDAVVNDIIPLLMKADFYTFFVAGNGFDKAIIVTEEQIDGEYQKFIDTIQEYNLAEVNIIQ